MLLSNDTLQVYLNIAFNVQTKYFFQLQCVHVSGCQWYLCGGYHKRSDSFKLAKLKSKHTCTITYIKKTHYQFDTKFIASAIASLVQDNLALLFPV
jgi:hypothetical protein